MTNKIISENYGLTIENLTLLDKHFGTEIHLMETNRGRYIVKMLPLAVPNVENEGLITEFLRAKDIPVARLLKTNTGSYVVKTDTIQFHVQEFIEGETLAVNTAPDWFMEKSADLLGRIHDVLQGYGELSTNFGSGFFQSTNAVKSKQHYVNQLNKVGENQNTSLIRELEERIKHLDRISAFGIDSDKLTYVNSHGDFYIGQMIVKNRDITVIDWTSACRLPAALEVMMSYVFAAPECADGRIDGDGLRRYIDNYSKHFSLTDYDIKIMPYLYYFQQIMCHYSPPYNDVPDTYTPICTLINNTANWLYKNVDKFQIIPELF